MRKSARRIGFVVPSTSRHSKLRLIEREHPSTLKRNKPLRLGRHLAQTKLFYILTVSFVQDLPQRNSPQADACPGEALTILFHLSKTGFECLTLQLSANPIYYTRLPSFILYQLLISDYNTAPYSRQFIICVSYLLSSSLVTSTDEFKFDFTDKLKGIGQ